MAWLRVQVRCEMALLGQDLERALAQLSPRERNILCMRYGLASVDGSTMTLKEIGRAYGLTRERIRQILDRSLRKLRHPQRSLLGDYLHTLQPVERNYS
jgi:RNA polymerase primary sigma factor